MEIAVAILIFRHGLPGLIKAANFITILFGHLPPRGKETTRDMAFTPKNVFRFLNPLEAPIRFKKMPLKTAFSSRLPHGLHQPEWPP